MINIKEAKYNLKVEEAEMKRVRRFKYFFGGGGLTRTRWEKRNY